MAEPATKLQVKSEQKGGAPAKAREWEPIESLRRQVDRLFEDFGRWDLWRPFGRSLFDVRPVWPTEESFLRAPAVDLVEKEKAYEITAELPGLEPSQVEVKLSNGVLTIKGEKKEEKEEKKKDYYMSERRYGAFQRSFQLPDGIEEDKIEADFKNGVLTISLPKAPAAQKPEKSIAIKAK
jgi:HSP20 family protein